MIVEIAKNNLLFTMNGAYISDDIVSSFDKFIESEIVYENLAFEYRNGSVWMNGRHIKLICGSANFSSLRSTIPNALVQQIAGVQPMPSVVGKDVVE